MALLCYLAVRQEARRDELVDLLWGEVSEANARNAFRQALHRLRTALGEDVVPQDRDRVEVASRSAVASDRDAFLQHLERGDIAAAVDLYRGDFLEGFELGEPVFDGWVDAERTRLKGRFQSALQQGAESALGAGRWLEALQYVQRLTSLAPFDEGAALLEANVLVAAGRAGEALQALRRFSQVMREQLDLPPSQKVREMVARIERADAAREAAPTVAKPKETPFFGREPEIGRLMSLARGLAGEQGATILIEGPAGIGKSRLVAEFLSRARSLGPLLVLRGRERPAGSALPYASIAEGLRTALKAPGIAGTGRHLLAEAARILPELRDNFDLPEPGPIDAEGGRLRFFEGIAALLDSTAYEQPVCMVLDDVHHASPSTLDLVAYLAARLNSSPVLIILIHRSDADVVSAVSRIRDENDSDAERIQELTVGPLEPHAIRDLVGSIVVGKGVEGQLDIDRVAHAAAGNPLRAIELARRALNGELPAATPMPLRDILWSRLQRASPSQRRVFFAAALLQRRCSLRLLASAAHLPELATFEAARELEQLGLLSEDGNAYVVAHDFTTSFVADASGLAGKALLAGWAADALASEPSPPGADLASLYSIAGQQGPAFVHARRAVYDAAALGSGPEVNRMLGLALALAPDSRSREEVEGMLAAFGAGRRLLDAPPKEILVPAEPDPSVVTPNAAPASTVEPRPESAQPPIRRRRRPMLTPRLAALVILGTMLISMAVAWAQKVTAARGPRVLADSLMVIERGGDRSTTLLAVTGLIDGAVERGLEIVPRQEAPLWTRALQLPWIRPSVSPSGIVAVERVTETGTDVYLMDGTASAPVPVAVGPGTDAILGWAPDGASLLVRRSKGLADGSFDADLWVFRLDGSAVLRAEPIDTSAARSVEEEAAWAPDGTRIAWVAQTGPTHQREIFMSRADGSGIVNLTENPAEEYHISWSSDGNLLAFTSDRDGNPDLFALELGPDSRRLWRLTTTPAEEDFPSFSPDNRFVAFQSTGAGDAAVYIMPALGGVAARVTPPGGQFSIVGWRGRPPVSYIDRFRIIGPSTASVGRPATLSLFVTDREGNSYSGDAASVRVVDPEAADLSRVSDSLASNVFVVTPRRNGTMKVVASIPGWRYDTLSLHVGDAVALGLSDDFVKGISGARWLAIGSPRPVARSEGGIPALYPNGDLQWPSGLLSRAVVSLTESVELTAVFNAPFAGRPMAGATLTLALVADASKVDSVAPQLDILAGITWDGEASRFTYSVGPQSKSDPLSSLAQSDSHTVKLVIERDGRVVFFVDGIQRWTSLLRFLGERTPAARLWIGGRATGDRASIRTLRVASPR